MAEKKREDNSDVFEKALEDDYLLNGNQSVGALVLGIGAGMLGGRALGKRFASKAARKAENDAIRRADTDGSLGWGRSAADRRHILNNMKRTQIGGALGGTAGAAGAVYASTLKKKHHK